MTGHRDSDDPKSADAVVALATRPRTSRPLTPDEMMNAAATFAQSLQPPDPTLEPATARVAKLSSLEALAAVTVAGAPRSALAIKRPAQAEASLEPAGEPVLTLPFPNPLAAGQTTDRKKRS